jgi:antitoxin component YwqK of YwqJK toxin-antitoxin module
MTSKATLPHLTQIFFFSPSSFIASVYLRKKMSAFEDLAQFGLPKKRDFRLRCTSHELSLSTKKFTTTFFFYRNGNVASHRNFVDGILHGIETIGTYQGLTQREIVWQFGKKMEELEWSETNGSLISMSRFRGDKVREAKRWFERGGLKEWSQEVAEFDGKFCGRQKHKTWYESLREKESYETDEHGQRDGTSILKYESGLLCKKQEFRNGVNHGAFMIWNDDGSLLISNIYVNGILRKK